MVYIHDILYLKMTVIFLQNGTQKENSNFEKENNREIHYDGRYFYSIILHFNLFVQSIIDINLIPYYSVL